MNSSKVAYGSLAVIATLVVLKHGWLSALKVRIQAQTSGANVPRVQTGDAPSGSMTIAPTNASGEIVGAPISINPNG